ncbi:hypothetical protein, partial [Nitrospira sp. BLG_2]|uniref:hypothetical protein n=1 Tax=Nitrospira sp. BLG_2 TaxID=3397507 RepID=UPI003B98F460
HKVTKDTKKICRGDVTFRAIFRACKALIRLGNPLKCTIPRVPDSRERCHARESLRRRACAGRADAYGIPIDNVQHRGREGDPRRPPM